MSLSRLRPACTCLFAARQATLPFVGHSAIPSRYIRRQRWQSTTRPGNAAYLADSAKASPLQSTSSSATSQPGKRSFGTAVAVGAFGLIAGYGLCVLYPPGWYRLLFPLPAPIAPAADTPEGVALVRQIEGELQNLDIVKQLREEYINPATGQLLTTSPYTTSLTQDQTSRVKRWKESRPYSRMPESKKRHSLTQFSLRGPGKFAVNPLVFASLDEKETIAIVHVGEPGLAERRNVFAIDNLGLFVSTGNGMCGHNGIVHGGLLATLLDEAVARPVSDIILVNLVNLKRSFECMSMLCYRLSSLCQIISG